MPLIFIYYFDMRGGDAIIAAAARLLFRHYFAANTPAIE